MQAETVYEKMLRLDGEEEIGYAYYRQTGNYLDYMLLSFLKKQQNPCDFSRLDTAEAREYNDGIKRYFATQLSGMLNEQLFISENVNAEIQHLPRYIDISAHRHDFFEIVCTVKGHCLHRVEGKEVHLGQGDVTVIPPNVHHYLRAEPDRDCMALTIKIRRSTFDSVFSAFMKSGTILSAYFAQTLYSRHYRNSLTFHCGEDAFLTGLLFSMVAQQWEKKQYYSQVLTGLLAAFFPYLVQNYENTVEFSDGDNAYNERMIEIENYMRQNYKTATLQSTAQHFYLSTAYLSTMIRRQTGVNFSTILRRIRMENAAALLAGTDMKVEQICGSVGYCDTTQFIKTFKSCFGTTPLKFRKSERQQTPGLQRFDCRAEEGNET